MFRVLSFESAELCSDKKSCLDELALFLNEIRLTGDSDFDVIDVEKEFIIDEMIPEWKPRLILKALVLVKYKK